MEDIRCVAFGGSGALCCARARFRRPARLCIDGRPLGGALPSRPPSRDKRRKSPIVKGAVVRQGPSVLNSRSRSNMRVYSVVCRGENGNGNRQGMARHRGTCKSRQCGGSVAGMRGEECNLDTRADARIDRGSFDERYWGRRTRGTASIRSQWPCARGVLSKGRRKQKLAPLGSMWSCPVAVRGYAVVKKKKPFSGKVVRKKRCVLWGRHCQVRETIDLSQRTRGTVPRVVGGL